MRLSQNPPRPVGGTALPPYTRNLCQPTCSSSAGVLTSCQAVIREEGGEGMMMLGWVTKRESENSPSEAKCSSGR